MKIELQGIKITSLPELKHEIGMLWVQRMEDSAYLRSLVESMPRRLQAMLQNAYNATKY